jgi:hypothetical protein
VTGAFPSYYLLIILPFFLPLAPLLGSSLPCWNTGLIAQFLDLSHEVELLGGVISSSQGLYLNAGQHKHRETRTHVKHLYPRRDSNPQARPPSDRRLFIPQTVRLPRPTAYLYILGMSQAFTQLSTRNLRGSKERQEGKADIFTAVSQPTV